MHLHYLLFGISVSFILVSLFLLFLSMWQFRIYRQVPPPPSLYTHFLLFRSIWQFAFQMPTQHTHARITASPLRNNILVCVCVCVCVFVCMCVCAYVRQ